MPIKRLLNACLVLALGVNVVFYTTRPGFWGTALIFLTLAVNVVAVAAAAVMGGNVGYYLIYVLVAWLFALLVYYTVKMM